MKLFTEGDVLYDAMLASIAAARQTVRLESYIFADDEIGRRFAEALVERARSGIDVRLHLDAAGSLFWSSRRLERHLRRQGVQIRWFHRWNWRRPWRYNCRNHRKLLVVDGQEAYLGGFNIHRENSRKVYGEARWRDTHLGFQGALAVQTAELFDAFWKGRWRWVAPPTPVTSSVLLSNHSRRCRRQLRGLYREFFNGVRRSLYLTTPYFVPDQRTQRNIMNAARRGLDVRLLVPRKGDVRLARWAARAAYSHLLRSGVRIFEYLPRNLHAKTAVADGTGAVVGTANLDYRSLFVNYELNLFSRDPDLCSRLQDQFLRDLTEAEEIISDQWAARPLNEQWSESIGWMARRWL
jgi:cardiolipin synthase A/B